MRCNDEVCSIVTAQPDARLLNITEGSLVRVGGCLGVLGTGGVTPACSVYFVSDYLLLSQGSDVFSSRGFCSFCQSLSQGVFSFLFISRYHI